MPTLLDNLRQLLEQSETPEKDATRYLLRYIGEALEQAPHEKRGLRRIYTDESKKTLIDGLGADFKSLENAENEKSLGRDLSVSISRFFRLTYTGEFTHYEIRKQSEPVDEEVLVSVKRKERLEEKTREKIEEEVTDRRLKLSDQTLISRGEHVNLSSAKIGLMSQANLKEGFSELPRAFLSLNLASNDLSQKSGAELKEGLSWLPPTLQSVNLADNGLSEKNAAELGLALSGLPLSVKSVNLGQGFKAKSTKELIEILSTLPLGLEIHCDAEDRIQALLAANREKVAVLLTEEDVGVKDILNIILGYAGKDVGHLHFFAKLEKSSLETKDHKEDKKERGPNIRK